jgi:NAD(P)-dependent dehydrogenase (short-subunit alcohol dehydrogenase family)
VNDLWLLAAIPRSATPSEDIVQHVEHNLGPREVLVNNAGTIIVGAVENQSVETFEDAVNTNFWGPLYATLSVMDGMKRRKTRPCRKYCFAGRKDCSVTSTAPFLRANSHWWV